jgi:hypothetical protein
MIQPLAGPVIFILLAILVMTHPVIPMRLLPAYGTGVSLFSSLSYHVVVLPRVVAAIGLSEQTPYQGGLTFVLSHPLGFADPFGRLKFSRPDGTVPDPWSGRRSILLSGLCSLLVAVWLQLSVCARTQ